VERAGLPPRAPAHADPALHAAGPPGLGLADLRARPRRHRLGVTDEDAGAVGEDAHLHRRFLADFYAGDFPGSFARGARFQPESNGEARTSGTAAALAGLQAALEAGDLGEAHLAVRRILVLYAVAFAHGGVPLIYMGDELGLRNDETYTADPARRDDNRWMHRPAMDWQAAARREDPKAIEGRLWAGLRRLVAARRATRAVHAQGRTEPVWTGNEHVFGLLREHAGDRLLLLASFSDAPQAISTHVASDRGFTLQADLGTDGRPLRTYGDVLALEPYQVVWLRG
jgi:amylosucrase